MPESLLDHVAQDRRLATDSGSAALSWNRVKNCLQPGFVLWRDISSLRYPLTGVTKEKPNATRGRRMALRRTRAFDLRKKWENSQNAYM